MGVGPSDYPSCAAGCKGFVDRQKGFGTGLIVQTGEELSEI
ncbi:MAG: hypothetical protein OXI81_13225 [Paracoccaceae bacterium]|nr:hypothetical protein [Paracoccaceae bacterium]MDE2912948.1 hypothetical protein [Paracoccaceae bacterium]